MFPILALTTLMFVIVTVIDLVGLVRTALSGEPTHAALLDTALTAGLAALGVVSWVVYLSRPVEKD